MARGLADEFLESAAERSFGLVSNFMRDGGNLEAAINQTLGAGAIVERLQVGQVTPDRAEIKAFVLLIAACQRGTCEIPPQAKQPAALLGIDAHSGQILVDERPQCGIGERRTRRRRQ